MKEYLNQLIEGETLSREQTHDILLGITRQAYNDSQIAALLMALQTRGITVDELLGFRDGLLETGKHIDLDEYNTLDIVGTGGDAKNTFNISTCSAFVIAGAGYKVSKHGNGASTSVSGASTVLEAHGAKFTDNPDVMRRALDEAGIWLYPPASTCWARWSTPAGRRTPCTARPPRPSSGSMSGPTRRSGTTSAC